jgi:hypothetical protein
LGPSSEEEDSFSFKSSTSTYCLNRRTDVCGSRRNATPGVDAIDPTVALAAAAPRAAPALEFSAIP